MKPEKEKICKKCQYITKTMMIKNGKWKTVKFCHLSYREVESNYVRTPDDKSFQEVLKKCQVIAMPKNPDFTVPTNCPYALEHLMK